MNRTVPVKFFDNNSESEYLQSSEDYTESFERYEFSGNINFKDTSKSRKDNLYQCTLCKEYKSKSEFYKDKRVPCGIRSRCKMCYHKGG